jgi:RNA polymerase sigma factor (sigma-70 family)
MSADAELRALLERYERPLVRYAQNILGDLESARDVVQETFIKWVELHTLPVVRLGEDPPPPAGEDRRTEAWLFTVCRNRAIDLRRKHRRIVPIHPDLPERFSEEPGPGATLENRELAGSLNQLLQHLSENQREVIVLKFQNDLSYREIAGITELSVTNVGFLLHTGLKKLRALIAEQPLSDLPESLRQSL